MKTKAITTAVTVLLMVVMMITGGTGNMQAEKADKEEKAEQEQYDVFVMVSKRGTIGKLVYFPITEKLKPEDVEAGGTADRWETDDQLQKAIELVNTKYKKPCWASMGEVPADDIAVLKKTAWHRSMLWTIMGDKSIAQVYDYTLAGPTTLGGSSFSANLAKLLIKGDTIAIVMSEPPTDKEFDLDWTALLLKEMGVRVLFVVDGSEPKDG